MKVQVKGLKELDRKIEAAKKKLGLTAGEFADKSAQVLRDTVVRNAQPFGTGKKARDAGEKAILSDLHNAFLVVSNGASGKNVIRNAAAAANYHKSRRNSKGRVEKGRRRKITAAVFGALFEGLRMKVGMAKGSVMGGGELNPKTQTWVSRHKRMGDAKRRRKLAGAEWTFTAEPKHVAASNVLGERGVTRAMGKHRANLNRAMERDIKRALRREEKKMNKG